MMSDDGPCRSTVPRPRSVRRALQAMQSNLGHPWSLAELAAIAGVSARTLQRQFRSFLGSAPQAVLRDLGLAQARAELLQGASGDTVADIARRCGFAHAGRFSGTYRGRFGETPSETLKRGTLLMGELAGARAVPVRPRDRPRLAFGGVERAAEHAEMAEAIQDELVIALKRSGLDVITRSETARYRMRAALREDGVAARLLLQLFDQESGQLIWAQRVEGLRRFDPDACAQLVTRMVAALQPQLRLAEIDRAARKPDAELTAHDLALRALPGVLSLDAEGNARALDLLDRAMQLEPAHALGTALAAWAHAQRVVYHFGSDNRADRARGLALARQVGRSGADATVLCALGNALCLLDDLVTADDVVARALVADGGSAWAWSRSGWLEVYRGDAARAIERFQIALDLAPQDPLAFNTMVGMGCAHFRLGNYLAAARWKQRALLEHPSASWVHRTMSPAYMLAGATGEAVHSLQALRTAYPGLTVAEVQRGMPPLPDSYCSLVFEALSDAGLPA